MADAEGQTRIRQMLDMKRPMADLQNAELPSERSSSSGRAEAGPRRRVLDWMRERIMLCPTLRNMLKQGGGIWVERSPGDMVPVCILRTRAGTVAVPGSLAGISLQLNFVFHEETATTLDYCMAEAYFSFTRAPIVLQGFEECRPTLEYFDTFSGVVLPHRIHGIVQFRLHA